MNRFLRRNGLKPAADITIIGGSVVGCSVAYHLARRLSKETSICVIERDFQVFLSIRRVSSLNNTSLRKHLHLYLPLVFGSNFLNHVTLK